MNENDEVVMPMLYDPSATHVALKIASDALTFLNRPD